MTCSGNLDLPEERWGVDQKQRPGSADRILKLAQKKGAGKGNDAGPWGGARSTGRCCQVDPTPGNHSTNGQNALACRKLKTINYIGRRQRCLCSQIHKARELAPNAPKKEQRAPPPYLRVSTSQTANAIVDLGAIQDNSL